MAEKEEMTAPVASVGADAEQSSHKNTTDIISENDAICNPFTKYFEEKQIELLHSMDPAYMKTVSMSELYETVFKNNPPIIDGLLYTGTYLFVGAPKLGKSFFMAQLAYHVSTGTPLWNYPVRKGTVLYLALEDDYQRLQKRFYRMFGTECVENLYFSVDAKQLGNGLDEQLQGFMRNYPDTRLIIIDTLQKVREIGGDSYSYANDYEIITRLKAFADSYGICLMLVHHTRKQKSDDAFDMISGTNGLLGAADGCFLLHKEKRTSNDATLDISGRDQQDQKLYLTRNTEKLSWELQRVETELWKEPPEPLLEEIAKIVTATTPDWTGSPTELSALISLDIPVNSLTKKLNVNAGRLLNEYSIAYQSSRSHDGRKLEFHFQP
jgi:RecA-family ATPase